MCVLCVCLFLLTKSGGNSSYPLLFFFWQLIWSIIPLDHIHSCDVLQLVRLTTFNAVKDLQTDFLQGESNIQEMSSSLVELYKTNSNSNKHENTSLVHWLKLFPGWKEHPLRSIKFPCLNFLWERNLGWKANLVKKDKGEFNV